MKHELFSIILQALLTHNTAYLTLKRYNTVENSFKWFFLVLSKVIPYRPFRILIGKSNKTEMEKVVFGIFTSYKLHVPKICYGNWQLWNICDLQLCETLSRIKVNIFQINLIRHKIIMVYISNLCFGNKCNAWVLCVKFADIYFDVKANKKVNRISYSRTLKHFL